MQGIRLVSLTGAVLAAAVLALAAEAAPLPAAKPNAAKPNAAKPNVVLIISDDHGYTDYGFMGHKSIRTPRLDRLASESLLFTRGYATAPLCSPSLGTLLTGLYPHRHGLTGNDPADQRTPGAREEFLKRIDRCPHLPALLAQSGYVSFQTGKWWLGHYARGGFTAGMTTSGRHGEAGLKIGRETMEPLFRFIDQAKADGKPLYVWYAPMMPHDPHNPPPRLLEKYLAMGLSDKLAKYAGMVEWFDQTCGELLDYLEKKGLSEGTIVLYTTDNGVDLAGNRGKRSPYELGVRTPVMVRWPGRVQPRRDEKTLVSNVDIVPTILCACGLKPTKDMPGLNLLDAAALARRPAIFSTQFLHDMLDAARPSRSLLSRTCLADNWKLIVHQDGRIELFDLAVDPPEKTNLAAQQPQQAAAMQKLLDQWWDGRD